MNSDQSFFDAIDVERLSAKDRSLINKVWQPSSATNSALQTVSSGYSELDKLFANQGWPLGVTTEMGVAQPGIGELRLLSPAIRSLQQRASSARHVLWIAPPLIPLASSLLKEGIDLGFLTIVEAHQPEHAIWAAEQALLSNSCAAVMLWTDKWQLTNKTLRRLQLAAEKSGSWNVILRHESCLQQTSISHLRLRLNSTPLSELDVHILKQPNSWANQHCTLSLSPHYERWQRLPVDLLPHNNRLHERNYQSSKPEPESRVAETAQSGVSKIAQSGVAKIAKSGFTKIAKSGAPEVAIGPD